MLLALARPVRNRQNETAAVAGRCSGGLIGEAADRVNPALAELATALQPAVLRLIATVIESACATGRHVAVCGEAAADPEMIPILVGLGVDELSVAPSSVASVAAHLARLRMAACRDVAHDAIAATTLAQVRERLRAASLRTAAPD